MDIYAILMIVVFVVGYAAIALEHPIKVDKAASALLTGVLCWTLYVFGGYTDHHGVELSLMHHLSEIASILFFLMGAMTIVELIDAHEGFSVITDRINTTNKITLIWAISFIAFFLSAALDNLTTAIVMISLLRKLIKDVETRWIFAGFVIIAANAGGAWSPIGDVTTTMLWIKGQLPDVPSMILHIFLPAIVCLAIPLLLAPIVLRKSTIERPVKVEELGHYTNPVTNREKYIVFMLGLGGLLFVPIFKTVTHLPPFMGMMLSLGVLWVVTEIMHGSKNKEERRSVSVIGVLQKIDTASVLFFLGILLAVGALQVVGHLHTTAEFLDHALNKNIYTINMSIGLLSAIVDNVPLVAAAQGMYEIAPEGLFAAGGSFWEFLAYCAGTGGSCLIIGSAAGVAVMGLEHISFGWYLKKIAPLALVGYIGGAITYILMFAF
ncbi:MAG: sodium:proton antiporter NhaD [Flavobacteriales bacterium]